MAQSIVGTNLLANWQATSARVACRVRADWNKDGAYTGTHEDITERVVSVSMAHRLYDPLAGLPLLGDVAPGDATITVSNDDRFFSPDNAAGIVATYPNLAHGIYRIPVMIEIGYYNGATPERLIQFVGEIESTSEAESEGESMITFGCIDRAVGLLQGKISSGLYERQRTDTLINAYLTLAGWAHSVSLDAGMSTIPLAWADDENAWDECRALAASEGGYFFVGKEGVATFRRMTAPLERSDSRTSRATLDQGNTVEYQSGIAWQDVYSEVVMEYTGRYEGLPEEIWKAPRDIYIEAGEIVFEEARFRYPVTAVFEPAYGTDYNAVTSGFHPSNVVTITMTPYAQSAVLQIENTHTHQSVHVVDLKLRGEPLLGEEAQQARFASSLGMVEDKDFKVRDNPYQQTEEQVARVGGYLRDRLQRPRRLLSWRGPACPWLELLDRVHLSHNTMTPNPGVSVDCYVLANSMHYRAGGMFDQELLLLPVTDVFAYSDYFLIGLSTCALISDRAGY